MYIAGESEAILPSEVYEIDYKGPETHSSVPPPHHKFHSIPRKNLVRTEKALGKIGDSSANLATNKASILVFFFLKCYWAIILFEA